MGKKRSRLSKHKGPISVVPRRIGIRLERKLYLIVCEGTKSEPNYFKGLQNTIPRGLVSLRLIGEGRGAPAVVERAIREKRDAIREYDQVWVVFDRDEITKESFNGAIQQATKNSIHCAYSIECFELWYVLHFQNVTTSIPRTDYFRTLNRHLGEYNRSDVNIYEKIHELGDEASALNFAKQLYERYEHFSPATENPSTTVYWLVGELNQFRQ
jgi:hypothetical protein